MVIRTYRSCVGVIGGVWVCTGWTIKVGSKVTEAVTGPDRTQGIVAAEASGVKRRWGGGDLRARPNATGSQYNSYANTPMSATFSHASTPMGNFFPTSAPGSPLPPPPVSAGLSYMPPPPHATSPFPSSPLPDVNGFPASSPPWQNGFPSSPIAGQRTFPRSGSPEFSPRNVGTRGSSGLRNVSGGDGLKKVE